MCTSRCHVAAVHRLLTYSTRNPLAAPPHKVLSPITALRQGELASRRLLTANRSCLRSTLRPASRGGLARRPTPLTRGGFSSEPFCGGAARIKGGMRSPRARVLAPCSNGFRRSLLLEGGPPRRMPARHRDLVLAGPQRSMWPPRSAPVRGLSPLLFKSLLRVASEGAVAPPTELYSGPVDVG